MKKNLFYFLLLMAIGVMPLTSCDKENEPQNEPEQEDQHDPTSDSDQVKVTGYDALSWLQGALVLVNEQGDVVRRVYGKPLDASQPDVLSVPVIDKAAAEKLFLDWVAPTKEATRVEGGYDYALTDAEGKAQGSVSFRAVEGEAGVLARMTVNEGTDLKQVSAVEFLDASLWPENDDVALYEAGKIYNLETTVLEWAWDNYKSDYYGLPKNREVPFYCVQGNTDGKEALLVWLCSDDDFAGNHPTPSGYIHRDLYLHLPTVPQAEKVFDFFNANYDAWQKMLKEMDAKGYQWSPASGYETTGNSEFILNSYDEEENELKYLDLDGKTAKFRNTSSHSWYNYRYMQIKHFPAFVEQ